MAKHSTLRNLKLIYETDAIQTLQIAMRMRFASQKCDT